MARDQQIAVELAGYLTSAVGVGEAARRYVGALRAAGTEVLERDVPLPGRDAVGAPATSAQSPKGSAIAFNILCLNPEQMVPFLEAEGAPDRKSRATVGVWSWEVDVLPQGWREASRRLDEIWTYSSFAAKLIAQGVDVPVRAMPLPVSHRRSSTGLSIGLPSGFRFLLMFDFLSTLERKNPLGTIDAYRRAFQPGDGACLIVKSVNGRHRPQQQAEVVEAMKGRPDIALIDRTVTVQERDALIEACDCCLSLHRSEGYGLPLAEAMAMGKPVVATGYGGNMEFMDESNSYPVGWSPAQVGESVEHYPAGATWAEPDVEHAAELMQAVRSDSQDAAQRALRGQQRVLSTLDTAAIGHQMRAGLAALQITHKRANGAQTLRRLATSIRDALR